MENKLSREVFIRGAYKEADCNLFHYLDAKILPDI